MHDANSFHELFDQDFPFIIKYISLETDEVLEETVVDGPGAVMVKRYGPNVVRVEVHWPDGQVDK